MTTPVHLLIQHQIPFAGQLVEQIFLLFLECWKAKQHLGIEQEQRNVFIVFPLSFPGGSFRHFLWQVCKELQSSSLSLLLLCPSSAVNKNKV